MPVDLRLLDPNDHSQIPRLVFRPEALREAGIPETLIEAAARSIRIVEDPNALVSIHPGTGLLTSSQ